MAPAVFDVDTLASIIPTIFDQAQSSAATHKKNCVSLYKLQSSAASVTTTASKGRKQRDAESDVLLMGEKIFAETFLDMLSRVLVVKKGTTTADRVVKFVGTYVKFLSEKAVQQNNSDESDDEETFTSRFTTRLLRFLLKGFAAKDKFVRLRVVALTSEVLEYVGEIEQDLYLELRLGLIERLYDKEPSIRTQSVVGLSKVALSEDPEEVNDDEGDQPVMVHLLSTLSTDVSAEVRRSVLMHLPFTPLSLSALLFRSRDPDALTRKLVYSVILLRLSHPKQLTIAQRENVVKEGLGDREDAVRVAAAKLLGSWVDLCEGDLTSFLHLFDVRTSTKLTSDALKSVFVTRLEVIDLIKFDDDFWDNLTPETALLARTFVEHCITTEDAERLESSLPVVTALAFHLQTQYNNFLQLLTEKEDHEEEGDEEANEACEDRIADAEFVMSELLRLAEHLDYADEIGRRKMFGVVREMLGHAGFPDALIEPCTTVLAILSPSERDLVRVVVEVINELRDSDLDGTPSRDGLTLSQDADSIFGMTLSQRSNKVRKQVTEMTPEEKAAADLVDLRCLSICVALLERVNTSFEENSTLEGILADLVVPSVKRKELALREKGLASLGLCCLIAKNMAMNSFQLFLSQVKSSPESLRLKNIQIVFDIMMSYEKDLLGENVEIGQRVISFLMQVLEAEESKAVQALICLGLSKLMLFGLVTDERVLTSLVLAYVSPVTATNPELRQCLAYFLPAYCYSSFEHQSRMQSAFLTSFELVNRVYEEMEEDQDMINPLQFGQLLVDWTDPSKIVNAAPQDQTTSLVHVHLAIDLVKAMYDNDRSDEDKKIFCQLLGKLTLSEAQDTLPLYTLNILLINLQNQCPFDDLATRKLFAKFKTRFEQHFATPLEAFDEQECFDSEEYQELFEFMGVSTRPSKARTKKTKAPPVTEQESDGVEDEGSKPSRPRRATRSRQPDADDSDSHASHSDEVDDSHPEPGPSRASSPITEAPPQAPSDVDHESDNDGTEIVEGHSNSDQENRVQTIPTTPVKKRGSKRVHTPTRSPSVQSPVHKRQQRRITTRNRSPLENKTNKRGKNAAQPNGGSKPSGTRTRKGKQKAGIESTEDEEESQSPVPPRIMEEPGWDEESDI